MKVNARKRIGDILVESGVVNTLQIEEAISNKKSGQKIGDYLVRKGYVSETQLVNALAGQLKLEVVNLNQLNITNDILQLVGSDLAKRINAIPFKFEDNKLYVAMSDPMDYYAVEELRMTSGCQIETALATESDIAKTISKRYGLAESVEAVMSDTSLVQAIQEEETVTLMEDDSPIIRLVNQIISTGVVQRSSDIHFDPVANGLLVRYRIDGVLRGEKVLQKSMVPMIIARIKIISNLNITEMRVPQDGRIQQVIRGKKVDIRVSVLPSVKGEKIVMRILDTESPATRIENLGLSTKNEGVFRKSISTPNGIILITGPTGSGKSTTLYAALSHLNSEKVNIITVEDPVEYELDGITQVQVNEEVGLTFTSGLRSILRQDPDILMIGEIRDKETADIAMRASLTGHLVLSTLHTNSSIESISRLRDMGIEPFLISSSVIAVMGQRLVRQICGECQTEKELTGVEKELMRKEGYSVTHMKHGVGCPACDNTGYRGRLAIHEILPMDNKLKSMIVRGAETDEIVEYAKSIGFKTLAQDGLLKATEGLTTIEEVVRVALVE